MRIRRIVPFLLCAAPLLPCALTGAALAELPQVGLSYAIEARFDPATRGCDSYDSRPGMCRDYPRLLLHAVVLEFLPGCGYRAVARNAAGLRAALDRLPLDEERRRKLDEGLRLD